jgi:hypothetical protein
LSVCRKDLQLCGDAPPGHAPLVQPPAPRDVRSLEPGDVVVLARFPPKTRFATRHRSEKLGELFMKVHTLEYLETEG